MRATIGDSVIVITGASSGIGRATALKLAEHHAALVLSSRQQDALNDLAGECGRLGARAIAVAADVANEAAVKELANKAVERFGRIDVWVNDAGAYMLAKFDDTPSEAFRRIMDINFYGVVHGTRAALAQFRKQEKGTVINIASVLGKVGVPYATAYAASKHAIIGFDDCLRMELLDSPGIHVCSILPSTTDTPLFQHAANYAGRAIQAMPPVYPPEEVADAIIGCIEDPRREVLVGNARQMIALHNMAPPLADKIMSKQMDKKHFQERSMEPCSGNLFTPLSELNRVHGGWQGPPSPLPRRALSAAALVAGAGLAYMVFRRREPAAKGSA